MGKWSEWKKIAKYDEYYIEDITYDGPSCYELGVRQWLIEEIESVYVGETKNEKNRITRYVTSTSHLEKIIEEHLNDGYALYYRSQAKRTKSEAKKMQDNLLSTYEYEWNIQLNSDSE